MAGERIDVHGLSELLTAMEALPREMASKNGGPLRAALAAAARMIRDDAKKRAPVDSGTLQRAIVAARVKRPEQVGATESYIVGVRKMRWSLRRKTNAKRTASGKIDYRGSGDAFYWRFVEFGTVKQPARPFLRPAFEAQKRAAVAEFKRHLAAGIRRIVKRVARLRNLPRAA